MVLEELIPEMCHWQFLWGSQLSQNPAPAPTVPTDYSQLIQMFAPQLVTAVGALLAGAGIIKAVPSAATVNLIVTVIGIVVAIIGGALTIYRSRKITQSKVQIGAMAYAAGVAEPQANVSPTHPAAQAAGVAAWHKWKKAA